MVRPWVLIFFSIFISKSLFASELFELYRGARASAMGGAYTALADDEQAVFLNPAGLAGVKRVGIHYFVLDLDTSYDTITTALAGTSTLSNLNLNTISSTLMGKNIYGRAQISPTLIGPGFGLGILIDAQAAVFTKNRALPQETLGYQFTNGIQFATGFSVNRAGSERIGEFRVGFAVKALWRRGGYRLMTLTELMGFNTNTLASIAGNYALGLGVDLGVQYMKKVGKSLTFSAGSSLTDFGDTAFGGISDPQRQNLSVGVAAKYALSQAMTITVDYDLKHLTQDLDWRKRNHFGVELGLPLFTLYGGFYETYLSYGLGVDLWVFRLTAASYAEEVGVLSFQDPERRYMLRLALKIGM